MTPMPNRQTKEQKLAFVKSLPRKRIVACLVAYHGGRLLIVKPTYRDGWLLRKAHFRGVLPRSLCPTT